jgi:hypothetical protein
MTATVRRRTARCWRCCARTNSFRNRYETPQSTVALLLFECSKDTQQIECCLFLRSKLGRTKCGHFLIVTSGDIVWSSVVFPISHRFAAPLRACTSRSFHNRVPPVIPFTTTIHSPLPPLLRPRHHLSIYSALCSSRARSTHHRRMHRRPHHFIRAPTSHQKRRRHRHRRHSRCRPHRQ